MINRECARISAVSVSSNNWLSSINYHQSNYILNEIYHVEDLFESVGRKGHWIFVLNWNQILNIFYFLFSLSPRKTNFKSQFQFSIKIEKSISGLFLTRFFYARVLIWPITSLKKRIYSSILIFFFKKKQKTKTKLEFLFLF